MRKTFKELMGAITYNEGKDLVLRAEGENLILQMADGTNILKFGEKSYNENKGITYLLEKIKFNLEVEESKDDDMERVINELVRILEKRGNNSKTKEIIKHANHLQNLKKVNDEMERINNIENEKEQFKEMLIFGHRYSDILSNDVKAKLNAIESLYDFHKNFVENIPFEDFVNSFVNTMMDDTGDE